MDGLHGGQRIDCCYCPLTLKTILERGFIHTRAFDMPKGNDAVGLYTSDSS